MNRPNYRTKLQVNLSPAGTGDSLNKRDYPLLTVLFSDRSRDIHVAGIDLLDRLVERMFSVRQFE